MCVSYPTLYCTCGGDGGGEGDDAALADRRAVVVVVEGVIAGQLNAFRVLKDDLCVPQLASLQVRIPEVDRTQTLV